MKIKNKETWSPEDLVKHVLNDITNPMFWILHVINCILWYYVITNTLS